MKLNKNVVFIILVLIFFNINTQHANSKQESNLSIKSTDTTDTIYINPISIKIDLSEKAKKAIIESTENIVVSFSISLEADDFIGNSPYRDKVSASEDGKIWLYDANKIVSMQDFTVVFENIKIPLSLYKDLKTREVYGFGQCYSGRKVFNKNILKTSQFVECNILEIKSEDVFTIKAELIKE